MRSNRLDTQDVMSRAQRLLQLDTDLPAARAVQAEHVGQVLGADHRPPRPMQVADDFGRIDDDVHRTAVGRAHSAAIGTDHEPIRSMSTAAATEYQRCWSDAELVSA